MGPFFCAGAMPSAACLSTSPCTQRAVGVSVLRYPLGSLCVDRRKMWIS
jgi:hypothetical protein